MSELCNIFLMFENVVKMCPMITDTLWQCLHWKWVPVLCIRTCIIDLHAFAAKLEGQGLIALVWLCVAVIIYLCVHYIYKVCGHPFKLVDLAISATPIADRCIKSSTQPCNLHRQTLAVELPYWRAQWLSTWHHQSMPPVQQVSSSNFFPDRAVLVNWKCCYCEVEMSRSSQWLSREVVGHTSSQNGTAECWSV